MKLLLSLVFLLSATSAFAGLPSNGSNKLTTCVGQDLEISTFYNWNDKPFINVNEYPDGGMWVYVKVLQGELVQKLLHEGLLQTTASNGEGTQDFIQLPTQGNRAQGINSGVQGYQFSDPLYIRETKQAVMQGENARRIEVAIEQISERDVRLTFSKVGLSVLECIEKDPWGCSKTQKVQDFSRQTLFSYDLTMNSCSVKRIK